MRRLFPLLALALALVAVTTPPVVRAQEGPTTAPGSGPMPQPAPVPPKPSNQNVRIDVTIALKGDAKPLTKTLTMVAADGRETKGRAGIEIPVATSLSAPGSTVPTEFRYRSVGVNVDATPQILDATHVLLRVNIQFSTVYKPEGGQGAQPSFGQGSHEVRGIVFESGKPVVVTQAADGETGRDYTVEVKATLLK
jgi:Bacterial type II and III secretion system protein